MTNAEKVIGKDAVAALRAAGMIVVAHDAIRLAQAHAVAIEQERVRQERAMLRKRMGVRPAAERMAG